MEWNTQQAAAIDAVGKWLADRKAPQVLRLFGWAGTGKTTLARHIAGLSDDKTLFAAFAGKAAQVLRNKGCYGASTIHGLIYKAVEDKDTGKVEYKLNQQSDILTAGLVVIDECSMVGPDLGADLLSFGTKVLVLGDPFQLPPVNGQGFFTDAEPDIMLTDIRRQAADNPIIRMSMDVREGRGLDVGHYGESRVIRLGDVSRDDLGTEVLAADQVLVGRNRTRRTSNWRIRQMKGLPERAPIKGDRLVCLKNNRTKGLLNGGMWTVDRSSCNGSTALMRVDSADDTMVKGIDVVVPMEFFRGEESSLDWKARKKIDEFDYGYAITCHKAQGSQWDNVLIFDESSAFQENAARWTYTAVTRAAERVFVVID